MRGRPWGTPRTAPFLILGTHQDHRDKHLGGRFHHRRRNSYPIKASRRINHMVHRFASERFADTIGRKFAACERGDAPW
ncbi:MAG: hypothetical protein EB039_01250 [Proteobacteria bacterium]|nr:hypothetical protein [Pseudomonadota bacterium]